MVDAEVERVRILRALLEVERPVASLVQDLAALPWDAAAELVTLRPVHVTEVLRRFMSGRLAAQEVEAWASAIECREDIALDPAGHAILAAALFDLANPTLQGALTTDIADHWLAQLSAAEA